MGLYFLRPQIPTAVVRKTTAALWCIAETIHYRLRYCLYFSSVNVFIATCQIKKLMKWGMVLRSSTSSLSRRRHHNYWHALWSTLLKDHVFGSTAERRPHVVNYCRWKTTLRKVLMKDRALWIIVVNRLHFVKYWWKTTRCEVFSLKDYTL